MFEADLQDEEIKTKKRRVLVVLLVFLLGTAAALPLVEGTGIPSAAGPEPTPVPPTRTPTPAATPVPVDTEEPTDTPVPPTREPTRTSAPTNTPRPTATSTPIPIPPTATEELPGGAGGGEMEASPTPVGASTDLPTDTPVPPTPTPEEPGELPVTGADVGGSGRLALGLAALSVGTVMLIVGLALRTGKEAPAASQSMSTVGTVDAQSVPSPWLALGLTVVMLVLMLVAGYALHRNRER